MGRPISSRRIDSTKPGTTGSFHHESAPIPTPSFISAHPPRSADESYIRKLHAKVTGKSYMRKLQMHEYTRKLHNYTEWNRPRRVCESYS